MEREEKRRKVHMCVFLLQASTCSLNSFFFHSLFSFFEEYITGNPLYFMIKTIFYSKYDVALHTFVIYVCILCAMCTYFIIYSVFFSFLLSLSEEVSRSFNIAEEDTIEGRRTESNQRWCILDIDITRLRTIEWKHRLIA